MMKLLRPTLFCLLVLSFLRCETPKEVPADHLLHELNSGMIHVVSEDLFSPPVAARIYAYVNLAAYGAAAPTMEESADLFDDIQELNALPEAPDSYHLPTAMITAYVEVGKTLTYRTHLLDSLKIDLLAKYPATSSNLKSQGEKWGMAVADIIKERSSSDGYQKTRKMVNYELIEEPYAWVPTAPMFGEALEPHWALISPFWIDSVSQYRLPAHPAFDSTKSSEFHEAALAVMEVVSSGDSTGLKKAIYWDCNPGPTMVKGHVMQVNKQNTPPGHWMGIHAILAKKARVSLAQSAYINAVLMTGICDAVIAAWETKYHYNLLRPETYIQRYINPDWKPLIESPLFPEYASAHSSVSAVAAVVLDKFYGRVEFYDDTNQPFGHVPKNFNDVWEAAEEAARSRYLGGIHYLFSSLSGFEQGKEIGQSILQKLEE